MHIALFQLIAACSLRPEVIEIGRYARYLTEDLIHVWRTVFAALTHSCNVRKPWCGACAKCCYVWLQFAAHLPADVVHRTFGEDLGERAGNERWFRSLLGLAEHTPFECVGSAPEARLALTLARARGFTGARLASYAAAVGAIDLAAIAAPFLQVGSVHGMPDPVARAVMPELHAAAAAAARRIASVRR